ncbi:MAG: DUF177 domain-containing protein [Thermodesulfobacteriota bacterium]|nr:DUF177 domain-containing protein [Thermodesulfobacteriota bacterium]
MGFILGLDDIPKHGLCLDFSDSACEFSLAGEDYTPAFSVVSPCKVNLTISKNETEVSLSGAIHASVMLECCRCLKFFPYNMNDCFKVTLVPLWEDEVRFKEGQGAKLEREDLNVRYYDGVAVDLCEIVRDEFLLSLPSNPSCTSECYGLCPICGVDLNEVSCECRAGRILDSRFEILKKFVVEKDRD